MRFRSEERVPQSAPNQLKDEAHNPCVKELKLSYKCLDDTGFDRGKCEKYFANYKTCKEFWNRVRSDRRREGIEPLLPPPEERAQIKSEYMKLKNRSKKE